MILSLLTALALLLIGSVFLLIGADWFVDGAADLARTLGVSALVIGILLAGLEPEEMLTAALASVRGAPSLALGNILGTNITIITAGLGLSALIFPLTIDRSVRRQALIATLVSILPVALLLTGTITQLEGLILLLIFAAYTLLLLRTDRAAFNRLAEDDDDDDDDDNHEPEQSTRHRLRWKPILLTLAGLAAMAIGGPAIVEGALRLTSTLGLTQAAVGATIVSLGTGAEMLALGISAARKRQSSILVGGILGSFAYNLLVTLGLAAAIHPLPVTSQPSHSLLLALPIMVITHLILLALIWHGKISRTVGGLLLVAYLAYLLAMVLY